MTCNGPGVVLLTCHPKYAEHWTLGTGHWTLGMEHWELGTEHWPLDTGHGIWDTMQWALSTGH